MNVSERWRFYDKKVTLFYLFGAKIRCPKVGSFTDQSGLFDKQPSKYAPFFCCVQLLLALHISTTRFIGLGDVFNFV